MKQLISIAFLLALFVSGCSQEEMVKNGQALKLPKVTATFDQNGSRTYIENGNLLRWNENDQISFFYQYTFNSQYQFDGETGDNAGTFSPINQMVGTGTPLDDHNYAVYPYASGIKITENGVITTTLPSEQSYAENSFGLDDNTMVAVTEDKNDTFLNFKNVGGYLMLRLYGEDVTVKTITLTGNNNEKLAGKATVTSTYGGEPSVSMAAEATETITLDCGEGVELGTSAETATPFWFVVPPTAFENGFTITVEDVNGGEFTKTTSKIIEIERNAVQPMAAFEVEPQVQVNETPYLTFSADATQSLTISQAVATLEYSVNGGEWKELGTNTVEFGGQLGDLRLRGKSSFGTATKLDDLKYFIFGNDVEVLCYGDIRTLIDYENYATTNTSNAKFISLFYGCTSLITAPSLPAKNLASDCYFGMFVGCTNLKNAPELPATKLADYCYESMFSNCSSLTKAPQLPATELAPACYRGMFKNCVNLTTPPELPATELTWNCYYSMFEGCSSLITAPVLPATKLAVACYYKMFAGCSSLNEITMLAPSLDSEDSFYYWVDGVSKTGEFIKSSELKSFTRGASGIPDGWTMKNYGETTVDEIPYLTFSANAVQSLTMSKVVATLQYSVDGGEWKELGTNMVEFGGILGDLRLRGSSLKGTSESFANYSQFIFGNDVLVSITGDIRTLIDSENYKNAVTANAKFQYLFKDCTNITTAPKLPATTLAESCYRGMFSNCTNLIIAPELPATQLTNWCYEQMFLGCTSLKKAPKLPAMTLVQNCYTNMFSGCSSLEVAPELPATTLAYECYKYMFSRCTSLISAPQLLATKLESDCYSSMFSNCTSLTTTPKLPAVTLAKRCYLDMFYGCTSLKNISTISATTLAGYCCQGMFGNCISLTTTPELPATTLAEYCYSGMFSNCTGLVTASRLPATTLVEYCYDNMFSNCANLKDAPELPATRLAKYCYNSMFFNCSSLEVSPKLLATTLVENCYQDMFRACNKLNNITMLATDISKKSSLFCWVIGVSSSGTFIKAETMTSLPNGSDGIPNGWTVKNYGE